MLIDPVEKFMSEENDAAANDRNAEVPDDVSTTVDWHCLPAHHHTAARNPHRSKRASRPWARMA